MIARICGRFICAFIDIIARVVFLIAARASAAVSRELLAEVGGDEAACAEETEDDYDEGEGSG